MVLDLNIFGACKSHIDENKKVAPEGQTTFQPSSIRGFPMKKIEMNKTRKDSEATLMTWIPQGGIKVKAKIRKIY
jgi:hypothetical protein